MVFKPLYNVRPIKDLKDMMEQSTKLFPDNNAFMLRSGEDKFVGIKYSEFKGDIDGFGTAMLSLGLKDKFIAVIGENRYEWCVTYLATANGVGVIVPLDKELPLCETEHLLIRSDVSAVVFSSKFDKEMKMIAATHPSVKYFIRMDHPNVKNSDESNIADDSRFMSYSKLVKQGKEMILSGDRSYIDTQIDAEKLSILLFTSGTTDLAKGVMLSHKNICADVMAVCEALYIASSDSSLSILPIHHTYECTAGFLVPMYNGCSISFCEGLKHISKNLKETKPTLLFLVPLILENMYKKIWEQAAKKKGMKAKLKFGLFLSNILYNGLGIDIRKKLFKQIHDNIGGRARLIISGAAGIDPNVLNGLRAMGLNVLQGYGLTECSPIATVNREKDFKTDSIGQPLPGVEVKLANINEEGIGELIVKGRNVMLGYFDNKLATDKVLKDGWLYTGDLGHLDPSGFFYITGRKKNVIVTKNGKNIFPEEVEAYLNKSPYIQESLIWGKYDEVSGETYVTAQIVPYMDLIKEKLKAENPTDEDVFRIISTEVKSVNKVMPLYKRIKDYTIRENEFEKTTTKKIKRYIEKIS